uniref:TC10 protein n=1 Tax=Phallusia mammillata TaxID=59560 RepID=A0A6F9DQ43_9ASCI|nr:TC10 protein [Phallusia mammillata]
MASLLRCVVVGDGAVGKTSMLISYSKGDFPDEYVPTILDQYAANINVGGTPYLLELIDTAGQEDYDRLRPLSYNKADIFLVCYSVVVPSSFTNIKETWIPELKEHAANVPFLLVGTQIDLRDDARQIQELHKRKLKPITKELGQKRAAKLGAACYKECSAVTMDGIKEVFDEAIHTILSPPEKYDRNDKRRCVVS